MATTKKTSKKTAKVASKKLANKNATVKKSLSKKSAVKNTSKKTQKKVTIIKGEQTRVKKGSLQDARIEKASIHSSTVKKIHSKAGPVKVAFAGEKLRSERGFRIVVGGVVLVLLLGWLLFKDDKATQTADNIYTGEAAGETKPVVSRTAGKTASTAIIEVIDNSGQATPVQQDSLEQFQRDRLELPVATDTTTIKQFVNSAFKNIINRLNQADANDKTFSMEVKSLQEQIQQLKSDITALNGEFSSRQQDSAQQLGRTFLGQQMVFLTDSYHRGTASNAQLQAIREFAEIGLNNAEMVIAVDALMAVSPQGGIITLPQLSLMASKHQRMGPPTEKDLVKSSITAEPAEPKEEELTFAEKVKRKFSDWVTVSKTNPENLPDYSHPWMQDMDELQYNISRGDVANARLLLVESGNLNVDIRLQELSNVTVIYLEQQQALQRLLGSYKGGYRLQIVTNNASK